MTKLRTCILPLFIFAPIVSYCQGLINNGSQIVFSGGAQMYIAGGANGSYLSQGSGLIYPSAAGIITIEGDWTNNSANTGFASDNGTVKLNGANEVIKGTNSTTFYNLTLQGSGTKTQNLNTNVGGVSTTNGVLSVGNVIYNLNSFLLTVTNPAAGGVTYGTGYILSETNVASNPSIVRWNMGISTGAHVFPFGVAGSQIPFTFNKTTAGSSDISVSTRATSLSDNIPWAGASNVGAVNFFYCPNNGMSGNPCAANSVIDRWWDITPTAAVTANVTFSYRGIENTLTVPYNTGNIGAQWWDGTFWNLNNATVGSALAVTSGVGSITANNLSQFCPYILSSVSVPLPIELVDFTASCFNDNKVVLNWSTATEKNGSYFAIMNSSDGSHFTKIASVNATGNSNSLNNYSYTIENRGNYGNYYQLKMVDIDQSSTNSKIIYAGDECDKEQEPALYYNAQSGIVITSINKTENEYSLNVYDAAGRLVKTNMISISRGYNNHSIDPQLANGVYLANLLYSKGKTISRKIVIVN
ncbi:MAG: T9SS type A sorting domain-containing protein [Bacteroidia bacterium]